MKFCCIIEKGWQYVKSLEPSKGPKKGDIVTKKSEYGKDGVLYYKFEEWGEEGYKATEFIPINESKKETEETMKEVEFTEIKKDIPVSAN